MSITLEYAREHFNDPAVLCCRAEAGTVLNEHNLEDPAIFDDLVDSGLLDLNGALTIGQVLGATLQKTCDSTAVKEEIIDKIQASSTVKEVAESSAKIQDTKPASPNPNYNKRCEWNAETSHWRRQRY